MTLGIKSFGSGITEAYAGQDNDAIRNVDLDIAMMFMPLPKGLQLFGRGTGLVGSVAKSELEMTTVGEASKMLNYYTKEAVDAGLSSNLIGARVRAGLFTQISSNVGRLIEGKPLRLLYSNSEASIWARAMQNQAIGLGALNLSISGTGAYRLYKDGKH